MMTSDAETLHSKEAAEREEEYLEQLFWEFDAARKVKLRDERSCFKTALRRFGNYRVDNVLRRQNGFEPGEVPGPR